MGVRGLTTLVENHSRKILQELSLHDTKIVIDGYGLLWYLITHIHGADPMSHGGEYELLRSKIQFFFQNLLKCNCCPYVIFDGSFDLDDKKHNTLLERFKNRIKEAKEIVRGGDGIIMPPLALHLMKQVMKELDVSFAFSQFEADKEIAILANHWHCPVLAKDSDFYVMDIAAGYIPLTLLRWKNVQRGKGVQCSISGQIFYIDSFCRFFRVKKELLPLFATLAGNDYVDSALVQNFLSSHVYSKYASNYSKRQSQLEHLLCWLSAQDSFASALEKVLEHVLDRDTVERLLSTSTAMYEVGGVSSLLQPYFEGCSIQSSQSQICTVMGAPLWVAEAHQHGKIASLCINILSKRYCFSSIQVENPKESCAWMPSKFLFSVLIGIILPDSPKKGIPQGKENCTVYIRNGDGFQRLKIPPIVTVQGFGKLPSMCEVPSMSQGEKQRLMLQVLSPGLPASTQMDIFPADFQLALIVTLHWMNSSEVRINQLHITSLLAGWVYLYAQRQQKRHRGKPAQKQGNEELGTSNHPVWVESKVVEANMSHHQSKLRTKKPDPIISHGFAQWQICLLHALHLSELLQQPLQPCPDISVLFNGLIMHSLYTLLRDASGRESLQQQAKSRFFKEAPRAFQLFMLLYNFITANTRQEAQVSIVKNRQMRPAGQKSSSHSSARPKTRRAHQQRTFQPARDDLFDDSESDSDSEWRANNRFAALY